MNPLLHAEMSNARSADIARNLKRHRPAPAVTRSTGRSENGRGFMRMASALRPLRHAA